jgi:hypothetical protein
MSGALSSLTGVGTAMTNTSAGSTVSRGAQGAARDHALHQPVEIDLLDMHSAGVDRIDHMRRDVDANTFAPLRAISAAVGRPI